MYQENVVKHEFEEEDDSTVLKNKPEQLRGNIPHKQRQHFEKDHENKYLCDKCDYKATKTFNLRQHIAAIHEGVRYSCEQCDYKATTPSNLKQHRKCRHEGVKYPCDQCTYIASQPFSLHYHVKSNHRNTRSDLL